MNVHVRKADMADIPRLREIIEASVRGLQAGDYSPDQIEGALASVYGVDSQLIADGTYFAAEIVDEGSGEMCDHEVGRRVSCESLAWRQLRKCRGTGVAVWPAAPPACA